MSKETTSLPLRGPTGGPWAVSAVHYYGVVEAPGASFGARLRWLRLRSGLSQEALAERAGVGVTTVAALEQDLRRHPHPHTVEALATALDVKVPERATLLELASRSGTPAVISEAPTHPNAPKRRVSHSPTTPLVGREADLAAARDLLDPTTSSVHLLSLVGAGGVGKTRLALAIAADWGEAESGLRLAVALATFWYVLGRWSEGSAWLDELLGLPAAFDAPARATALAWAGQLAYCQGEFSVAESWLREGVELASATSDLASLARNERGLGNLTLAHGELEPAREHYERCISLNEQLGSLVEQAIALPMLAETHLQLGHPEEARTIGERALAIWREVGDAWGISRSLHRLARIAQSSGDHAAAEPLLREALTLQRELQHPQGLTVTLISLAQAALSRDDRVEARALLAEGLRLADQSGDRIAVLHGLQEVALQSSCEQMPMAVELSAAADRLRAELKARPYPAELERLREWREATTARLGQPAYEQAWTQGERLSVEAAIGLAQRLVDALWPRARSSRER